MRRTTVIASFVFVVAVNSAPAQTRDVYESDFALSAAEDGRVAVRFLHGQRTQRTPVQGSVLTLDADLTWRWPPPPWDLQDSAWFDYKRAVAAMDEADFRLAATLFGKIHRNHPRSAYAAESFYWHAFSLYRIGGGPNLRAAVELLDTQQRLHPRTRTASDGLTLATRMRGELAKNSEQSRRELADVLQKADECSPSGVNVKIAALSAFQQIDPDHTVRMLRSVFRPDRQACGRYFRQQSVFILAQIESPEATDLMLYLAQNSPELEVRVDAVSWLAEVHDVRAVALLEGILRSPSSQRLKESALFALSRHATLADASLFREIAAAQYMPAQMRAQAVTWLAEQRLNDQSDWILRLYNEEKSPEIRRAVVRAVSEQRNVSDRSWLLAVGRDTTATIEVRRLAISSAASLQAPPTDLFKLYTDVNQLPLREQIIDILGRHREQMAIEMLIDIATVEGVAALRGTTVNWLRQSKDPRAVAFISSWRER